MTCGTCNGNGTRPVRIYNTQTHTWQTIHESCLSCNGTGHQADR
jgi:hypothetical protein